MKRKIQNIKITTKMMLKIMDMLGKIQTTKLFISMKILTKKFYRAFEERNSKDYAKHFNRESEENYNTVNEHQKKSR